MAERAMEHAEHSEDARPEPGSHAPSGEGEQHQQEQQERQHEQQPADDAAGAAGGADGADTDRDDEEEEDADDGKESAEEVAVRWCCLVYEACAYMRRKGRPNAEVAPILAKVLPDWKKPEVLSLPTDLEAMWDPDFRVPLDAMGKLRPGVTKVVLASERSQGILEAYIYNKRKEGGVAAAAAGTASGSGSGGLKTPSAASPRAAKRSSAAPASASALLSTSTAKQRIVKLVSRSGGARGSGPTPGATPHTGRSGRAAAASPASAPAAVQAAGTGRAARGQGARKRGRPSGALAAEAPASGKKARGSSPRPTESEEERDRVEARTGLGAAAAAAAAMPASPAAAAGGAGGGEADAEEHAARTGGRRSRRTQAMEIEGEDDAGHAATAPASDQAPFAERAAAGAEPSGPEDEQAPSRCHLLRVLWRLRGMHGVLGVDNALALHKQLFQAYTQFQSDAALGPLISSLIQQLLHNRTPTGEALDDLFGAVMQQMEQGGQ